MGDSVGLGCGVRLGAGVAVAWGRAMVGVKVGRSDWRLGGVAATAPARHEYLLLGRVEGIFQVGLQFFKSPGQSFINRRQVVNYDSSRHKMGIATEDK